MTNTSFPWLLYKLPQIQWLETTEMYSLTVLEAKNLRSRHWQGHVPSKVSRGDCIPCFFLVSGGCKLSLTYWLHSHLCLYLHVTFSPRSHSSLSILRTFIIGFRAHPNPADLI